MYKRILVTTDGSSLSKKAVASAVQLASLTGAELVAVRVIPRYPQSYFEGSLPLSMLEIGKIEKQWADDAQSAVDAVKKAADAIELITDGMTIDEVVRQIIQLFQKI